ncbi:MAG: hypothetical protein EOO08_08805 [Chitinophagaceae bacterium]|nr:MAG: hypothetical protein EOO08_08805 [Chitinophagaceae bacterium]
MRKGLFCALLLCVGLAGAAQNAYYNNPPGELLMVRQKCVAGCDGADPKMQQVFQKAAGVFSEGERFSLKIVNHSNRPLYFAIIDLQPDNIVNIIAPIRDQPLSEYRVAPHDTVDFAAELTITPPFGVDKLLTIWSEEPIDLNAFYSSDHATRSKLVANLLQEVKWILEGVPSAGLAKCRFGFTDIVIIPTKEKAAKAAPQAHGWAAASQISIEDQCSAAQKEPEKLYSVYPLLSLVQPLQAGATRGIKPEHKVTTQAFVLKGTAAALKGLRGIAVNGASGALKMLANGQYYWEKEVRLQPGRNQFEVIVETTDGHRNCEEVIVDYEPETKAVTTPGANHLLLIGINEYTQWTKLKGARRDVDSIEQLFTGGFNFDPANVHKMIDGACTKEGIDSVFRALIASLGPTDNLVVYFAGHGTLDKQVNEGYWIPVDARMRKPIDYLSNTEIKKYLEALRARHVLVIADACFSGGFFKTNRGESFEQKMEKMGSRWLLCSGREEEVADVMPGTQHSPFAFYLMKFLRAAPDEITASQLFQLVKVAVSGNAQQTPIGGPVSNAGDEGGEFVFHKTKSMRSQ